jgi:hypothetical protein
MLYKVKNIFWKIMKYHLNILMILLMIFLQQIINNQKLFVQNMN